MTDDAQVRRSALRAEYEEEDAAAAEAEALEVEQTVLSVRLPVALADLIKRRAAAEEIPASVLVRRILNQSVRGPGATVVTVADVEAIARRVVQEQADRAAG